VWLYGLHADDGLKGGDIDLYVEWPLDYIYAKKLNVLMINKIGASPHLPIHDTARSQGIRLCYGKVKVSVSEQESNFIHIIMRWKSSHCWCSKSANISDYSFL